MKLVTGKRIGQSGYELLLAVVFSFILHALAASALLFFLYYEVTPKISIPVVYNVALVNQALEGAPPVTPPAEMPVPPSPEPPAPKAKAHAKKAAAKPRAGAMPELREERKPGKKEPELAEEAPEGPAERPGAGRRDAVAVSAGQGFKFPPYLAIIRDKIERTWNPPPGAVEMKARVQFTIHRSGRVIDARLESGSGNFYFDQAAMRAVLASSPFPPLPEGFFSDSEVFSVDLMEQE